MYSQLKYDKKTSKTPSNAYCMAPQIIQDILNHSVQLWAYLTIKPFWIKTEVWNSISTLPLASLFTDLCTGKKL